MIKKRAAHRPLLYGEETQPVVIKVPKSKVKQFKEEVKKRVLKKWIKK